VGRAQTSPRSGLKFLAGFEANGFARGNIGHFAGPGISTDAALSGLDYEYAEAAKLYPLASLQRRFHCFEKRFDCNLSLDFRNASLVGYFVHYVKLYHITSV
jgi:hypothetical protein